jgi:hypothetical protein
VQNLLSTGSLHIQFLPKLKYSFQKDRAMRML